MKLTRKPYVAILFMRLGGLSACLTILFAVPLAYAQDTGTVLKPDQLFTFSLEPEQEKLFVLQMKKGDFAEFQWLASEGFHLSFELYNSARKKLLDKSREIEESFSFVAPSDGDFLLVSKLEKSPTMSSAQKISIQYNNEFKLPTGTKLKGVRKINGFTVKIMTTPKSLQGSDSVLLIEKNGQLQKAMRAHVDTSGGFYFSMDDSTGAYSAKDKQSVRLYQTTVDKTGNGIPDIMISYDSGARAGGDNFFVDLGDSVKIVEACGCLAIGKNLKGGLLFESGDSQFAWWFTSGCMACVRPFSTSVILEFRNGVLHPNFDLMKKHAPSFTILRSKAQKLRYQLSLEPYKGAKNLNALNDDKMFGPVDHPGLFIKEDLGTEAPFWDVMLDLIYTGNEELAWQFLDLVWPQQKQGKAIFIKDFKNQLLQGRYWQMILEDQRSSGAISDNTTQPKPTVPDPADILRPTQIAKIPASRVPEANTVTWASVSVGSSYACAVTRTGAPYCWGHDHGDITSDAVFGSPGLVAAIGDQSIDMVSASYDSTCWVTSNGKAYCSGRNDSGQLGNGEVPAGDSSDRDSAVPTAVTGGLRFSVVSVGKEHACGLTTNGVAYCWGSNFHQQLGNSVVEASRVPIAVAGGLRFATLSAGVGHTCAVTTNGAAYCWGTGVGGELGDGRSGVSSGAVSSVPVAVAGGLSFTSVTASKTENFTCGLTTLGTAYCWGLVDANDNHQLGNGKTGSSPVPVAVAGGLSFTALSAGALHVCGVTTSGAAYCWGTGGWGQLGTGTTKDALTPIPVAGALKFASIASGELHTCGVTTGGALYCWGANDYGELGGATTAKRSLIPVAVPMPTDEDGFKTFFREFCSAVRKRDRAALESMMSPTIEFPVEIGSLSMAFDYLGYNNEEGWKQLEESITMGTKPYEDPKPHPITRITHDNWVLFGRGADGKWRWLRFGY